MCRDFLPFGATCGLTGVCLNGTCFCTNPEWTKSTEFAFYLGDETEVDSLWCNTNRLLLRRMYLFLAIYTIIALIGYSMVVKKWGNLVRLSPLFIEGILVTISSITRVVDPERFFGEDVFFTIIVSFSFLFAHLVGQGFYVEYINYLVKKYPVLEMISTSRLRRIRQLYIFLIIDGVVVCVLGFALPAVHLQPASLVIFRVLAFLEGLHFSITVFNAYYFVGFYIGYIEKFVAQEEMSWTHNADLLVNLRRHLPKLKSTKSAMIWSNVPWVVLVFSTLFWEYGLTLWQYYIPLLHFTWIFAATMQVVNQVRFQLNKNKKFARVVSYTDLVE
mmetsp:Transcript_21828/g.27907  ORF Transcript_21828/g.27907 Transcript_21828/m.27907 type:complete len:331 (+) Transcript_21828:268-1260(+)